MKVKVQEQKTGGLNSWYIFTSSQSRDIFHYFSPFFIYNRSWSSQRIGPLIMPHIPFSLGNALHKNLYCSHCSLGLFIKTNGIFSYFTNNLPLLHCSVNLPQISWQTKIHKNLNKTNPNNCLTHNSHQVFKSTMHTNPLVLSGSVNTPVQIFVKTSYL